jgi:hypothetical protein
VVDGLAIGRHVEPRAEHATTSKPSPPAAASPRERHTSVVALETSARGTCRGRSELRAAWVKDRRNWV